MKAITIHQPYASLIAWGEKRYETRSWSTPYRGPIAIHSGKAGEVLEDFIDCIVSAKQLHKVRLDFLNHLADGNEFEYFTWLAIEARYKKFTPDMFVRGGILAIGELTAVHPTDSNFNKLLTDKELALGWYEKGRFAWQIDNVRLLDKPIHARGQQGLWDWNQ